MNDDIAALMEEFAKELRWWYWRSIIGWVWATVGWCMYAFA